MADNYIEVFSQFTGVKGFFATKYGAVEGFPYNRQDIFDKLGLRSDRSEAPFVPVHPIQIHKDNIELIGEKPSEPLIIPDTDGLITDIKGVILTTVHADCLPVYFFDSEKQVIGLVHAGWRGTAAGIGQKAAGLMQSEYGCRYEDIQVFIGPGISRCCFETGAEVYMEFTKKWDFAPRFAERKLPAELHGTACDAPPTGSHRAASDTPQTDGKYYIDLKGINRYQLTQLGIPAANIQVSERCTCCEPETFCSYRREGGTYMRMGAGLCLI